MEKPFSAQCPHCQATLVEKQGKKGVYYTCPNWKKDGSGCEGTIMFPPKSEKKVVAAKNDFDQGEKIVEGLRAIYKEVAEINVAIKIFLTKK